MANSCPSTGHYDNQDGQNGIHGQDVLPKKVLVKELVHVTVISAPEQLTAKFRTAQMVSFILFEIVFSQINFIFVW